MPKEDNKKVPKEAKYDPGEFSKEKPEYNIE